MSSVLSCIKDDLLGDVSKVFYSNPNSNPNSDITSDLSVVCSENGCLVSSRSHYVYV